MLKITEEQKRQYYKGYHKKYTIRFPDLNFAIDNETLHSESVVIKESICDSDDFTLGGCIASSMEFEVSEIVAVDIKGLEFNASLEIIGEDTAIPMGTYRVDTCDRVDDKDYKKIVAYDALYDASIDVSEWYISLFAQCNSVTLKEFREKLLQHLGIRYVEQNLINDNISIFKTVEPQKGSMPGTTVLKNICTINAGFGHINRNGMFEVTYLAEKGLWPEEKLWPEDDLYPEDTVPYLGAGDSTGEYPEYRSTKYDEQDILPVTCVQIQTNDNGITIGSDIDNPYLITGNSLLFGKTTDELKSIGENILSVLKRVVYRPSTTTLYGLPYVEVGDAFALQKRTDVIETYVLSRTLTGIQNLIDTYETKGSRVRANEVTNSSEIAQLQGKMLKTDERVEEVSENIEELSEETEARFQATADSIEAEVKRAKSAEEEAYSRIQLTVDNIEAEVARANAAEGELSGRIGIAADSIEAEVKRAKSAEEEAYSRIQLTADNIKSEVAANYTTTGWVEAHTNGALRNYPTTVEMNSAIQQSASSINASVAGTYSTKTETSTLESSFSSRFTIAENNISTKVSVGNVCSEINQSADTLIVRNNRLIIESTNFSLDRNGNATFSGTLNAVSGTFRSISGDNGGLVTISNVYGMNTRYLAVTDGITLPSGYQPDVELNHRQTKVNYTSAGNIKIENCNGFTSETSSGYGNIASVGYVKSKVSSSTSSDERIKKNIIEMPDIANIYMSIPMKQFEYDDIQDRRGICFGTTAQAVENAFYDNGINVADYNIVQQRNPITWNNEASHIPLGDKLHYINWENLNAMTIYMTQHQEKKIVKLMNKVETLEKEIEKLKTA